MDDDVGHVCLSFADVVLESACELVGVGSLVSGPATTATNTTSPPSVSSKRSSRGARPVRSTTNWVMRSLALVGRAGLVAGHEWPLERRKMRVDVIDSGLCAQHGLPRSATS